MTSNMTAVEKCQKINLIDLPVSNISFDIEKEEFNISLLIFQDEKQEYRNLELKFLKIKNLMIGILNDYDMVEVASFNAKVVSEVVSFTFVFTLGFGKPSWEISFDAEDLTLSPMEIELWQ